MCCGTEKIRLATCSVQVLAERGENLQKGFRNIAQVRVFADFELTNSERKLIDTLY